MQGGCEGACTLVAYSKKVCLLGDFAVGKTSLVRRFVYNRFDDKYISTIGVKVSRKVVAVPASGQVVELTMMLWDMSDSEELDAVRTSYLRGAAGAVLVCDLTRPETLERLLAYAEAVQKIEYHLGEYHLGEYHLGEYHLGEYHLGDTHLDEARIAAMAAHLGAPYFFTSAKTGDEIETLFRQLGRLLVA
ncbi:MAG: GTP-binding protein [Chloroflexi bacterium HGW-Chloroflexi-1]|nr:MAG: GTP-binding protein [Chloroflexi bacterium HGW-Chloroflexi-1]